VQLHGLFDRLFELLRVDRLGQVLKRAVLERFDGGLDGRRTSHQQDGHIEIALARAAQELDAVHAGHGDVAHDGIELHLIEQLGGLLAVVRGDDFVARAREHPIEPAQEHGFVVGNENATVGKALTQRYRHRTPIARRRDWLRGHGWFPHCHRPYDALGGNLSSLSLL